MGKQDIRLKTAEYRAGICGHFGGTSLCLDGQTVKTKTVTEALRKALGDAQIITADTYGGAKSLPRCLKELWYMLRHCRNIIILPAHNSVRIFPLFLTLLNRFYHRGLHYVVIGGWLPELVKKNQVLSKTLKKLNRIYVETSAMQLALEAEGFANVSVMPNFKDLTILRPEELVRQGAPPFRVCTFSRVMREKGIEDAIEAVKAINDEAGRVLYTLDVYGQIDKDYAKAFSGLQSAFPSYVKYGGMIPFEKGAGVLKNYFALLFPTYYSGEGFAGTLLDAMAAGVPVVASDWKYNSEVVCPGENGVLFKTHDVGALADELRRMAAHPDAWNAMKTTCIVRAREFTPETAVKVLLNRLA